MDEVFRRIVDLEKQCHSYRMEIEILKHQLSHDCHLIQEHELKILKLEGRLEDDYR